MKHLTVVCPGFASDCLETLEEVALGLGETFEEHGGEAFTYIPCLNDDPAHISFLKDLALKNLQGWL